MKKSRLLGTLLLTLVNTAVSAVTVGPELIPDPGFDDPSSRDFEIGSSTINHRESIIQDLYSLNHVQKQM